MFNPSQFVSIPLDALRCLSQKSDCLLLALAQAFAFALVASSLFLLVFLHYIVFKDRSSSSLSR